MDRRPTAAVGRRNRGRTPVTDGPLIVQSDKTLLLEVDHPRSREARHAIAPFAELERSPEHVHTYRLTPLGLWNARAAGHDAEQVIDALVRYSRYAVPHALLVDVTDTMDRYGRLRLVNDPAHGLVLASLDRAVLTEVVRSKKVAPMLGERLDDDTIVIHPSERGRLKQALLKLGWPAEDLAGYVDGEAHAIGLREEGWSLRDYQREAVENFFSGGSGAVVLPCGAGKTIVGAAAMARAGATTLILVTNTVSGRQWRSELLRRTTLTEDEIGEYSGERKEIRPVTIATYQIMATRRKGEYTHLDLFGARDWGLIVYDEVHLLPAPVFRMTADIQSRRRLGLTATLVREDGRDRVLVIGAYLEQIDELGEMLDCPVIQGSTRNAERERLYEAFRSGETTTLVVSKVANFSIDLPEAAVAIQVSGTFGSRQEEAQRLGRVLRPKVDGRPAHFYTVVSRDTLDQDYAAHRQRFLAEQGYAYTIIDADEVLESG